MVKKGVEHLSECMVEIDMRHLLHPNNHVPHFPDWCLGSLDTFPVFIDSA